MAIRLPQQQTRRRDRRRECLSVAEAAEFLGVSVPFLYKWLDKIPHRKLGNRVLFGRVALIKWLDGRGRFIAEGENAPRKFERNGDLKQ